MAAKKSPASSLRNPSVRPISATRGRSSRRCRCRRMATAPRTTSTSPAARSGFRRAVAHSPQVSRGAEAIETGAVGVGMVARGRGRGGAGGFEVAAAPGRAAGASGARGAGSSTQSTSATSLPTSTVATLGGSAVHGGGSARACGASSTAQASTAAGTGRARARAVGAGGSGRGAPGQDENRLAAGRAPERLVSLGPEAAEAVAVGAGDVVRRGRRGRGGHPPPHHRFGPTQHSQRRTTPRTSRIRVGPAQWPTPTTVLIISPGRRRVNRPSPPFTDRV